MENYQEETSGVNGVLAKLTNLTRFLLKIGQGDQKSRGWWRMKNTLRYQG